MTTDKQREALKALIELEGIASEGHHIVLLDGAIDSKSYEIITDLLAERDKTSEKEKEAREVMLKRNQDQRDEIERLTGLVRAMQPWLLPQAAQQPSASDLAVRALKAAQARIKRDSYKTVHENQRCGECQYCEAAIGVEEFECEECRLIDDAIDELLARFNISDRGK